MYAFGTTSCDVCKKVIDEFKKNDRRKRIAKYLPRAILNRIYGGKRFDFCTKKCFKEFRHNFDLQSVLESRQPKYRYAK